MVSKYLNNILRSLTWLDALKNCRRTMFYGGNSLASITSKEENDFIANLANTTVWIGLDGKGVYRGELLFSSKWKAKADFFYSTLF